MAKLIPEKGDTVRCPDGKTRHVLEVKNGTALVEHENGVLHGNFPNIRGGQAFKALTYNLDSVEVLISSELLELLEQRHLDTSTGAADG